jgi:dihydroorotate dehydrogenase (fumarate)
MIDLSTTYLGLHLKNPLVVSSSPLSGDLNHLRQIEEAGAAAVVLPSLFEEQVRISDMRLTPFMPEQRDWLPESLQHIPELEGYNQGVNGYIVHLYEAKKALNIPVIASLNAYRKGGWARYARILEACGADALELNVYYLATRPYISGEQVEEMYLSLMKEVKETVEKIPVAVKLTPFFSAPANIAQRLVEAGARGLVLFNRFYQPDFDIETKTVVPSLELSDSSELRLRLRWVALLAEQIKADMAITGGVHTAEDVVKSVMAGAKVTMMASALLQNGISHLSTVLTELQGWLEQHEYESIQAIQGCLRQKMGSDAAALERVNYMTVLSSFDPANKEQ